MAVSGILAVVKILAGRAGHSASVVADGLESAGDVFTSGFVVLGLTLAAKPADAEHPYGHGRFETLTGLLIGLILTATGAVIGYHSLEALRHVRPAPSAFVLWPLAGSALVKSGLAGLKFHFGGRIQSAALVADAWNDAVDIFSATVAMIAVGLTLLNPARFLAADNIGGFVVGLIVIFSGLRVVRETTLLLVDTMPDQRHIAALRAVALEVPGVAGVEKCFARKTGFQYHVDLHLEVDPEMTVRRSHEIASEVRDHITGRLNWVADVLVHVEPSH
jgi:cation diffusion facilitator family transporter